MSKARLCNAVLKGHNLDNSVIRGNVALPVLEDGDSDEESGKSAASVTDNARTSQS
jgi:hypothetical protein